MITQRKYLFIVNPVGGAGRTKAALPALEKALKAKQIAYELRMTNAPGHAIELARSLGEKFDVLVSMGGDGTLNEVVNGLAGLYRPLGIIPVGTGNDFARSIMIPPDSVEGALEVLLAHDIRETDIGQINGRRFINVVGIGFDGRANDISLKMKFIKGPPRILAAIALTFFTYRRVSMKISFDDHELNDRAFLFCIGNGWSVGGGLILTPDARLDDGMLDLTYIRRISRLRILRVFTRLFDGSITGVPESTSFRSKRIRISSPNPLPIHIDGEAPPSPMRSIEIELMPAAQPVIGNWKSVAE